MLTFDIDMAPLVAKLERVGLFTNKPMHELVTEQSRLFVSSGGKTPGMIQVTPPHSAKVRGAAARKQGENAILKDLTGGKHGGGAFRGIFTVIDDAMLAKNVHVNKSGVIRLFARKDGTVYGCDQQFYKPNAGISEMREHHLRFFKNGRMTQAGGRTRDVGRWKFIEQMVVSRTSFQRYLAYIFPHVGIYASGFNAAASQLGAKSVPDWVLRHGTANGSIRIQEGADSFTVTMSDDVPFGQADTARRMQSVLGYRASALDRAMPHVIRNALKKAGFAAVTT